MALLSYMNGLAGGFLKERMRHVALLSYMKGPQEGFLRQEEARGPGRLDWPWAWDVLRVELANPKALEAGKRYIPKLFKSVICVDSARVARDGERGDGLGLKGYTDQTRQGSSLALSEGAILATVSDGARAGYAMGNG